MLETSEMIRMGEMIVGHNRAGVRYRARLKRSRREAERLAVKGKAAPDKGPARKGGAG